MAHRREPAPAPPDNNSRYIPLTQGQFTLVDADDYEWLNQWNWYAGKHHSGSFYAARKETLPRSGSHLKRTTISMHRDIMGASKEEEVDHWNRNTLDNRRVNLRKCTSQQNQCNRKRHSNNTSGLVGVYFDKSNGRWKSSISIKNSNVHIGYFDSAEEAARARDIRAKSEYGEFATLNFPQE